MKGPLVMLFASTFIVACCLLGSVESLHCFQCFNLEDCKAPKRVQCNTLEASNTINVHLIPNYNHVLIEPSTTYECYNDRLNTSMLQSQYKGCIYSGKRACELSLIDLNGKHRCSTCKSNDCNPADRAGLNLWCLFNTLVMLAIAKLLRP